MTKNKKILLQIKEIRLKAETVKTSDKFVFPNNLPQKTSLEFMSTGVNWREYAGTGVNEGINMYVYKHVFGVRLLASDDEGGNNESCVAQVEVEYDAIYSQKDKNDKPTHDNLQGFSRNAEHNLWPFWREHAHNTLLKMGIPNVMLPLNLPIPEKAKKSQKG
ncbi:MAG TPA: hypothetical protein EYQ86_07950 [Bacteroidetes bacterium]|nr:hypothetical protein [Bacteroidota bacterium]